MSKYHNIPWQYFLQLVLGMFLTSIAWPQCFAASFDCAKATKTIEKLVCSNEELSILDQKLSVVYSRSIAESANRSEMTNDQRRWLRDIRNTCVDVPCAIEAYTKRLTDLEKISGAYAEIPASKFISTLCRKLVDKSSREQILAERENINDINNDGRVEVAKTCWGGTMNTPCTDYFDEKGAKISIKEANYDRLDFVMGERSFRYAGRTFSLLSSDYELQKPISLTYVTPLNEEYALCKFDSKVYSVIGGITDDVDGVCKAVLDESKQIKSDILSGNTNFNLDNVQLDEGLQSHISVNNSGVVDIDNDGIQEKVVEFQYSDSGGRGCEFNFYDLLDESGTKYSFGEKRTRFLEMQGVSESYSYVRGCGQISNRLFRYRNKTYYENNVTQSEGQRHISLINGTQMKSICNFIRMIKVDGFKQIGSESMYFIE